MAPRSPIHFGPASNGEFPPEPPPVELVRADRAVHEMAAYHARRLGWSRRQFLSGPCGMAAALLALNGVAGCRVYRVEKSMLDDEHHARAALAGNEFILDAQTHHVDAHEGAEWLRENAEYRAIF